MLTWQQLEQIVKDTIRPLKGRKREQAAFAIAAVSFSAGFAIGGKLIPEFKTGSNWVAISQAALYAIGAIAFVYGVVRVWRLVNPPELPPGKDRPSAIKGPMAFTEADGELFRKLGRESELQKLLGLMLDDQVLMVVIRGASGAGKTSLLRAGLKHILGDRAIFHYWEAVPTEPDKGLLRAIQEKWPEGAAKPASLDELVNPADSLGRQSHVIVLDQFEQLRGNKKVFGLLSQIIRKSKPPHRITWVIAFRREFSADWMDFASPEQERGFRPPQDVSLRLFTAEQAREVIGQLVNESNLKDSIEQSVINNLIEAATVEGEVSPVDIGIGLLVLAELHERQSGETITIRDYQFHGGAEGLLTQYISRCLDLFPKENQEAILKAMLALRDPEESKQRLAAGLTIDELAVEAGTNARTLKMQLKRLADRDIRLLETDTPADGSAERYRLPHERLIPALYRLTGKLLAEVDQVKLKFQNAFQAWNTNNKQWRLLLRLKELSQVERYETQIPWGNDEQEKKSFLNRSRQRRRIIIGAVVVTVVFVLIWNIWEPLTRKVENYLEDRAFYTSLATLQPQMKRLRKLELTRSLKLEKFNCFTYESIEEFSLNVESSSYSLESLSKCDSLKKLTLNLHSSQVSNLEPLSKLSNLTQLTLNLYSSQVSNLEPLSKLSNLTQLTLDLSGSQVNNLEPLSKLSNLTQLTLDLSGSQVSNLEPLSKMKALTQLTLDLGGGRVSNLEALANLSNLRQLSLDLMGGRKSILNSSLNPYERKLEIRDSTSRLINSLDPLSKLGNLTKLALGLGESRVSNLEPLSKMNELTQLTLDFGEARVTDWAALSKLKQLKQLTVVPRNCEESDFESLSRLNSFTQLSFDLRGRLKSSLWALSKLSNLTKLTLDLSGSREESLELLSKLGNLTELTLDLSRSEVNNLEPLSKLSNLTQLTLDLNDCYVINLEALSKLSNLIQLTLHVGNSLVNNLEPLSKLSNLMQLKLYLSGSRVGNLEPLLKLNNLIHLTLSISKGQMRNLEMLSKLSNLTQLSLDLSSSEVSNLESLSRLSNLTQLTLDLSSSDVSNLESLSRLSNLTQLTLKLGREYGGSSQVSNLEPLSNMTHLQKLSIENATRAQRMSLRNLPSSLVELKF